MCSFSLLNENFAEEIMFQNYLRLRKTEQYKNDQNTLQDGSDQPAKQLIYCSFLDYVLL